MEVEIKALPKMRVAGYRHVGPYPEIGPVFGRLWQWVNEKGIQHQGAIAVWLDDPSETPEAELKSDALMIVNDDFTSSDEGIMVYDIPEDTYAVYTHRGSYAGLPEAWGRMFGEFIPASGKQPGPGTYFEKYVDDCSVTPEAECRTELYAPVM